MMDWFTRWAVWLSLALTIALGVADYATGLEITFFVFTQVFPIGLAVWFGGRLHGALLAALATALGTAAYVHGHAFGAETVANVIGTFGTLLIIVWTLGLLRDQVERERRARRIAIEQLRHAERLNVIGALAAGVAHELGTPLNVISGTAEMLEGDAQHRPPLDRLAHVILAQTEKINAIVRHLLDFGRRGGASKTLVDLNQVAASTVELLASAARRANVTITLDAAIAPIRTQANGAEIEQVLSNLVLNGIQAMPRGGGLRVTTRATNGLACVTVEDEGIGIAKADLERIFDPFFTTKGIGQGTGLGLSVSHGIVADHGGAIDVRSEVGHGTTFAVMLPITS
jgi:signal transduction histidine kinase